MEFLYREIESQLAELVENGFVSECRKLNESISSKSEKYELCETAVPMHFSGDLNSRIVFVELNPGKGALNPKIKDGCLILDDFGIEKPPIISNLDSYLEFFKNLGYYKSESNKTQNKTVSRFDKKQLDFFYGFRKNKKRQKVSFTHEDVAKARKEKLQIEIVPFMSSRFSFEIFEKEYIQKRLQRVKYIINSRERDYVFISGNEKEIFKTFGVAPPRGYQAPERQQKLYIGTKLIDGVKYCFIRSYKSQSLHGEQMQDYGRLCRELLDDL